MAESTAKRTTDWSQWRARALSHLAPDERADAPDPTARPALDARAVLETVQRHGVEWVLAGSAVLAAYGADIRPHDLDIVPQRGAPNLERVAVALMDLDAIPAYAPDWRFTLTIEECRRWRPFPAVEENLDHQFITRAGIIDIVPHVAGSYDDLMVGAAHFEPWGIGVHLAHPARAAELMSESKRTVRADLIRSAVEGADSGVGPDRAAFERTLAGGG